MNKKEKYVIAALGLTLVVVAFAMIFFIFSGSSSQRLSPTPTPTQTQTATTPRPFYNQNAQAKLLEKLNNRQELPQQDSVVKEKIISIFPKEKPSGLVYSSANVRIEYISSADQFQVEILTTDVAKAKKEAGIWLNQQGFSQKAICDLPVMFYLNYNVANQLKNQSITFNPLAEGC